LEKDFDVTGFTGLQGREIRFGNRDTIPSKAGMLDEEVGEIAPPIPDALCRKAKLGVLLFP
jgi:hypothetical protein